MVEEITGSSRNRLGRLTRADKAKVRKAPDKAGAAGSEPSPAGDAVEELPGELQALIDRVKQGDAVRLERVHEVLEKLQRGELISSDAVRAAAERILSEGP